MVQTIGAIGPIDLVLAIGDNFYYSGIPTNEHDPRSDATFENVFPQDDLQVPWYVLAGNHDHRGNVTAQIAYSNISKRWNFPSLWYNFKRTFTAGHTTYTVEFVMIDSVILAGMSYKDDET